MDVLRFCAALAVVLGHTRRLVWNPAGGPAFDWADAVTFLTGFEHQAVMMFFVLSGFWIARSVDRHVDGERFWARFLTDRLTRLWIVLIPAIAMGAACDLAGSGWLHGAAYRGELGLLHFREGLYPTLTATVLAGNALFLQSLLVAPAGTNVPLWSLAYEFWYYLWFAAAAALVVRRRASPALAAFAAALLWPQLIGGFAVWLLGSGLYYADRHWSGLPARPGRARLHLGGGLLATAAALALVRLRPELDLHTAADILVGLAFAWGLWGLLRGAFPFPRWLAPAARYGAQASFSLYVTHLPLLAISLAAIGYGRLLAPGVATLGLILALTAFEVAAGWAFSRFTEARTTQVRQVVRERLSRPKVIRPASP
jgi:peptidoglycan/LPS O-acetylase OafA/YrhL